MWLQLAVGGHSISVLLQHPLGWNCTTSHWKALNAWFLRLSVLLSAESLSSIYTLRKRVNAYRTATCYLNRGILCGPNPAVLCYIVHTHWLCCQTLFIVCNPFRDTLCRVCFLHFLSTCFAFMFWQQSWTAGHNLAVCFDCAVVCDALKD